MKFLINEKITSSIPSTELFNLGTVITTINSLLNASIISIDQNTLPILKIGSSNYLINNFNPNNYKEDFEILLTESDLILISSYDAANLSIPLTGTSVGNPVTGTIETIIDDNLVFKSKIGTNVVSQLYQSNIDNEVHWTLKSPSDLTINALYTPSSIIFNSTGEAINIKKIGSELIVSNSSNINFKGLTGALDYSPNITDLDYTQKKYVDNPSTLNTLQRSVSTSGSNTINDTGKNMIFIHEAGATASLTINMPATPKDNQIVSITSIGGIVALVLATSIGTIIGSITALAALTSVRFIWSAAQSKWYKIS